MDRKSLPTVGRNQTVGLLGGSFDPAHDGHVHITLNALMRFSLGQMWWLVSPGNPLKSIGPASIKRRLEVANKVMEHPRVRVTDLEIRTGTINTADTVSRLKLLCPHTKFVWIMGADNLATFHHWARWRDLMRMVPIGVVARPGERTRARLSHAASVFRRAQVPPKNAALLATMKPPAWCFVNIPMVNISSTDIRARGGWSR